MDEVWEDFNRVLTIEEARVTVCLGRYTSKASYNQQRDRESSRDYMDKHVYC